MLCVIFSRISAFIFSLIFSDYIQGLGQLHVKMLQRNFLFREEVTFLKHALWYKKITESVKLWYSSDELYFDEGIHFSVFAIEKTV